MAPTPFGKPVATNDSVFEEVDLISARPLSQIMFIQRKCISDTGIHGITPTSGFR